MTTTLRVYEQPALSSPVMMAGLPGIESVAWLAVNHLVTELKAAMSLSKDIRNDIPFLFQERER